MTIAHTPHTSHIPHIPVTPRRPMQWEQPAPCVLPIAPATPPLLLRAAEPALNGGRQEAVFVDTGLAEHWLLQAAVRKGLAVLELDAQQDGLRQLALWAAANRGYHALHILSHAAPGVLNLGAARLTHAALADHGVRGALAAVGAALAPDGALLLYGCELAAGSAGRKLIGRIAALTGTGVAASVTPTGAASLGADWQLACVRGAVDCALPLDEAGAQAYPGLLATTVSFNDGDPDDPEGGLGSFNRNVGGAAFTFAAGSATQNAAYYDMLYDPTWSVTGVYALTDRAGGSGVDFTITAQAGYTFDLTGFAAGASTGTVRVYYNGMSTYVDFGKVSSVGLSTESGLTAFNDVTSITFTSEQYALFQDLVIDDVKAVAPPPTVSDAAIAVTSSGSGTGGAYKVGDTITATWNNTAGGDNNSGVTGVTMDFSQFGGSAAVAASDASGTWTASYTITAGSIDQTGRNVSVSATSGGGTATKADTTGLKVDNQAAVVSDANLSISGGSGTAGAFKIGDTVTATWNNTAGGDNNSDMASATVDFSQFGGGSAVTASASSGTWTATFTVTAGAVDSGTRNVSFTVTDDAGNVTTKADGSNAVVDSIAPTVSDARIAISGASGTGGAYKIGDTVTASWNNTAGGDNNGDIAGVTVDFSQFGGGAAVAATNSSGTWSASYTIAAGALNGVTGRNVSVTATDDAGNSSTAADGSNAAVDSVAPTVTFSALALSNDTGTAGDFVTGSAAQTVTATLSGAPGGSDLVYGSLDGGATWSNITSKVSGTTLTWNGVTLAASGTLRLKVTDAAGNDGAAASQAYTVDASAPSAPSAPDLDMGSDSGSSASDNITSDTTPALSGTAESGSTVTLYDTDGVTVLGSGVATGGNWSITASAMAEGSHTVTVKATDAAGNVSSASSGLALKIDTTAPSGVALSGTTVAVASATGGASILTLSATDSNAVSYALVAGNGSNDADNASFAISGSALNVGGSALSAGSYAFYVAATDAAGNVSNQAFTLTVANIPTVTSIVRAAGASATVAGSAASVDYTVTFSESVTGVDAADFALTASGSAGGSIAGVSGSGDTYTVTVNTLAGDGTLRLDLNGSGTQIENAGNVGVATGYTAGATYTLDHTAPAVSSIALGGAASTKAASVTYTVTLDDSVTGVDPSDFALTATGTANGSIASVTGSGSTYTVTVSSVSGDGTLRLDLKSSGTGIADAAGNAAAGYTGGAAYTIDNTAPVVASIAPAGATATNGATSSYTVTFADSVTGVDAGDFALTATGSANGSIASVTGSGNTYTVSVNNLSGEGTLRLDLNASGTAIQDTVGNAAAAGYTSGQVLTLDQTAPTLAITSDKATLAVGESATITFTFSETPGSSFTWNGSAGDVAVSGGTLGPLSGSGAVRTAQFIATTAGPASVTVAAASYTDIAGNSGGGGTSPALTVSTPTGPVTPTPVPGTVDGVPTQTVTTTDPATGLVNQAVTVPVIAPGREEDPSSPHSSLADIPLGLGAAGGAPATQLTVSLPTGTGLVATGATTLLNNSQALLDLILRIESRTQSGSDTQADMTGQGGGFLSQLGTDVKLQTKTLVLSSAPGAAATSIEILGSSSAPPAGGSNATAIGIVIDASQLPAGSTLKLNDVDFAAVVGAVTVRGGSGQNYVVGDAASQNIMLGAEDDSLSGGAGNDFIGSMGGNDTLDGGADDDLVAGGTGNDVLRGGSGSDMLQGGRSDTGGWQFLVSAGGQLTARHDQAVFADGRLETVQKAELNGAAAGLSFLGVSNAALVDVALLYGALERAPDLAGLDFWTQRGLSLQDVAQGILQSAEWQAANGAQSDSAFVSGLYQHMLGRAAEAAGQQFWEGLLAQGASRAQVLLGMALSPEHRELALTAQGYAVGSGSVAREQGWFAGSGDDRLDGGAGSDVLAGGDGQDTAVYSGARAGYRFLLGAEGQIKVGDKASGDIDTLSSIEAAAFSDGTLDLAFLQAPKAQLEKLGLLYQAVLDRAGDTAGVRWWLERGESADGGSGGWAAGFAASAEFKARYDAVSDAAFVQALYANSGLADSAAGGIATWQAYLAGHTRAELIGAWIAQDAVQAAQFGTDGLWLV